MSKPTNTPPTQAPAAAAENKQGEAKAGGHKTATMTPPSKNNVMALPGMCMAEDCKARSAKASFCMEHFDWFKEGLITKEGRRPTDFEKKYFDYTRRLAKKKSA
jgi:hypothetical protein